ncbi:MAG: hypothetical protein WCP45_01905 [Verrucomicrobiota bacterium]
MRGTQMLLIVAALAGMSLTSCNPTEPERQAVPPVSNNSKIPWNSQGPTGGQGQFGMLQQNQYRR